MNTRAPLVAALAATFSIVLGSPIRAEAHDARAFIQETADQVLVILRDTASTSEQKVHQLEEIAYARFDFATMARLVLARNWLKLTPEQQREFTEELRRHLSVSYGKNIETYREKSIEIVDDREEARGDWTVRTKILRSGDDVLVDYRLRQIDGAWKVIDVVIERVGLVANFRSQLQEVVANDGAEAMLRMLRERNAAGQSILPNDGKVAPGDALAE